MGHCGFPRVQILRQDGTWLPWIDGSEWCAPDGSQGAHDLVSLSPGWKAVRVESQAESDALGKVPPKTGNEFTIEQWHEAVAESRG